MNPMRGFVVVAGLLLGYVVVGLTGLVAGVLIALAVLYLPRLLLAAAVATPVVVAVITLLEEPIATETARFFPERRPVAHEVGMVGALVWIGLGLAIFLRSDRPTRVGVDGQPGGGRDRRPLVLLLAVAVLGTLWAID